MSIHTFLGWPALESNMPEKMAVHWIIIKEPNKTTGFKGKIYILSESMDKAGSNFLADFFGYGKNRVEPRLYGLKYDRELHEQLEKGVMSKLRQGRPVAGKFIKAKGEGKAKSGNQESDKKGGGSESQEQKWEFHELLPSEIHEKPAQ
tara:strand:+ start:638 stop:1081 length:444 start_codon:yes stop_codon:yes gene_type:complete